MRFQLRGASCLFVTEMLFGLLPLLRSVSGGKNGSCFGGELLSSGVNCGVSMKSAERRSCYSSLESSPALSVLLVQDVDCRCERWLGLILGLCVYKLHTPL